MSRNISIKEALGMATKTLVSNKLRSSLTMLGIIIGNASVITLVGLGRGAQTLAKNQLSNLGANVLFIVPGNNDTRRRGCLLYTSPSPRDAESSRMPSSA